MAFYITPYEINLEDVQVEKNKVVLDKTAIKENKSIIENVLLSRCT